MAENGDVVVWANSTSDPREYWINCEDDGPFLVVMAWENGDLAVQSLSTGKCMHSSGVPGANGCGAYHPDAFRKDDYLTAVYQRRQQAQPLPSGTV